MPQENLFEIGDLVRAHVTGDYALEIEVTGTISAFYGEKKDRAKIKTTTGHSYMVHLSDCVMVKAVISHPEALT